MYCSTGIMDVNNAYCIDKTDYCLMPCERESLISFRFSIRCIRDYAECLAVRLGDVCWALWFVPSPVCAGGLCFLPRRLCSVKSWGSNQKLLSESCPLFSSRLAVDVFLRCHVCGTLLQGTIKLFSITRSSHSVIMTPLPIYCSWWIGCYDLKLSP